MKPIITVTDNNTLRSLLTAIPKHEKTKETGQLVTELERAEVIPDEEIDDDVIRINSYFELEDVQTGQMIKLTLTLPRLADFKQKKISVLSPLGVALIGFKQGMVIDWVLPGGLKK
ncbi:MAG TPA: GreA/GreB family elongation factor, partial [Bacteroidia bacterium]|nr:GreA/GreB family elongation factor [Bacteroidia bacterium]